MDMNFLQEYMMPVVVGICLCIGYVLKNWVRDVDNKYIPTVCMIVGLFIAVWNNHWIITPPIVLSGMLSGLASTGLHQLFKQLIGKGVNTETKMENQE